MARLAKLTTVCRILVVFMALGSTARAQQPETQASTTDATFTLEGDAALWTVAIRPDKAADFERVIGKVHEALAMAADPQRRRQAAGWKVIRMLRPLPDGNVAYTHLVQPVIAGADYSVMRAVYMAFPDEREALYALYRGAFVRNVALATGTVVLDLSAPTGAPSSH